MPDPFNVFEDLDREPGQPRMSDLWEWARDDYLAGEAADVVCERHRLSRSQFFERARREGWLRRDQPRKGAEAAYDAEAEDAFVEEALDRAPPSAYALYRRAWARVERAVLMGRRIEAAGWTRLARDLRKLACEEANGASWRAVAKANEPAPDSANSPLPRSGGGGREAVGGGDAGEGLRDGPLRHGAEEAPRHLPRCAGEEQKPASADSHPIFAHPRGSGDPGLSGGLDAAGLERAVQTAPHAELSAQSLGPRFRGDERDGGGNAGDAGKPDSPDSLSAIQPLNRQDRRRLAKLGAAAVTQKPRPGFRSADAMG